jgi:general secretion pathway protein B
MSYILDALKRSERDRRLRRGPIARSIYDEAAAGSAPRSLRPLLLGCAAAVLLLGAGAAAWLQVTAQQEPLQEPAAAAAPARAVAVPTATVPEAPRPEAAVDSSRVLEVWELGPAEQDYLRDFDVSMHVYSPDPAQRAIVFNGLRVAEGQSLGADLRLRRITTDGIVVEWQGRAVRLPVDMGW